MVKTTKAKSPGKRKTKRAAKSRGDPRQLGLFDALDAALTRKARGKASKAKLAPCEPFGYRIAAILDGALLAAGGIF